jgi:hypothetical protein
MVRRKPDIPVGTRFKLSKLGEARNPRLERGAEGTIVGGSRYKSSLRVVIDGRKTPLRCTATISIRLLPTRCDGYGSRREVGNMCRIRSGQLNPDACAAPQLRLIAFVGSSHVSGPLEAPRFCVLLCAIGAVGF